MKFILLIIFILSPIISRAQEKWKYDFVVPDNGNFVTAIKRANDRKDKSRRFRIFVKEGNYRIHGEGRMVSVVENGRKVEFPSTMTVLTAPNTSIIGEEWQSTQIETSPQHEGLNVTSTLFLDGADSTYIQDIEFWSNYKNDPNAFTKISVALNEKHCKGNIFKNVSLLSNRNTYYTNDGGTTYLEDCTIMGTVDFICGGGTIYFNRCDIGLRTTGKTGIRDVICAPATENNRSFGYVFNDCLIEGDKSQDGIYMLATPWKNMPKISFVNTIMSLIPAKEGYCDGKSVLPSKFSEYISMDSQFNLVDLSQRRTSYTDKAGVVSSVAHNLVMTDEEAEATVVENVYPGWNPVDVAQQVYPSRLRIVGRTIIWEDVPEAGCYAICRDRKVIAFTTEPKFVVPRGTYEGACFSIRCANKMGGLGPRSNEVVLSSEIKSIPIDPN